MEANATPTGEAEMTNPDVMNLKMILALLEAIEIDDEDDAKAAVKKIKTLLGDCPSIRLRSS